MEETFSIALHHDKGPVPAVVLQNKPVFVSANGAMTPGGQLTGHDDVRTIVPPQRHIVKLSPSQNCSFAVLQLQDSMRTSRPCLLLHCQELDTFIAPPDL